MRLSRGFSVHVALWPGGVAAWGAGFFLDFSGAGLKGSLETLSEAALSLSSAAFWSFLSSSWTLCCMWSSMFFARVESLCQC